jgi:hypothetical protein
MFLNLKLTTLEKFQKQKKKIKRKHVNKYSISGKNIYLVSSKASIFENKDLSPDGNRDKYDLELFPLLKLKYDFYI